MAHPPKPPAAVPPRLPAASAPVVPPKPAAPAPARRASTGAAFVDFVIERLSSLSFGFMASSLPVL